MNETLDDKDYAILDELRKNSRLSEKKLSRRTNIPMTTVHNRIRRLRESGIIENFTIKLDYSKIGKPMVAYVLLKAISSADQKELLQRVARIPQVQEAAMITGEFDIFFKVRVSSMEELNSVVVGKLRKQKTVGETRTMLSYETIEKV